MKNENMRDRLNSDSGMVNSSTSTMEVKMKDPPDKAITSVNFCPSSSDRILASSWDSTVRLYDTSSQEMLVKITESQAILDCCFQDETHALSGGSNCSLKMYDLQAGKETTVGLHSDTINCIQHNSAFNCILTGSWDSTVKCWDTRSNTEIASFDQDSTVLTMDSVSNTLVVGGLSREINIWDLRSTKHIKEKRESSLKFQTTCIRCFPNQEGFVYGSTNGRMVVEFFEKDDKMQKSYAFKCHRVKTNNCEFAYSVNTLSFHKEFCSFASGGDDGHITTWDPYHKLKITQFHKYPASVSCLSFCQNGSALAIGVSNTNESASVIKDGVIEIYVRHVAPKEIRSRKN